LPAYQLNNFIELRETFEYIGKDETRNAVLHIRRGRGKNLEAAAHYLTLALGKVVHGERHVQFLCRLPQGIELGTGVGDVLARGHTEHGAAQTHFSGLVQIFHRASNVVGHQNRHAQEALGIGVAEIGQPPVVGLEAGMFVGHVLQRQYFH
jgi:hypothetical protein